MRPNKLTRRLYKGKIDYLKNSRRIRDKIRIRIRNQLKSRIRIRKKHTRSTILGHEIRIALFDHVRGLISDFLETYLYVSAFLLLLLICGRSYYDLLKKGDKSYGTGTSINIIKR
jgi:hypothetical protein